MKSKERAYLKGLASTLECVLSLGKNSLTPEFTEAVNEALSTKELIKINVLKNCDCDIKEVAGMIADRTNSMLIQVIGRKIVLYRPDKDKPKIVFPER